MIDTTVVLNAGSSSLKFSLFTEGAAKSTGSLELLASGRVAAAWLDSLEPGALSSLRHWHLNEDEFVMVLSGELVMIEDEGETLLRPGDCATHKAGVANGHHLVNRASANASFLVVGTRAATDRAHYPDVDMLALKDEGGSRFVHRDGSPY